MPLALPKIVRVDASLLRLYSIACFVSLSFLCFGFDTGSIGSITTMPQFEASFSKLTEIRRGAVVSSMLASSALTGFMAGPLADRISRKFCIALGALIFAAGEAICVAAPKLSALVVGRLVAGCGEGFFLSISATYLAELSPAEHRGRVNSVLAIAITSGITLGYFTCYGTNLRFPDSSAAWRIVFGLQVVFSLIVACGCPFLPFSPRYLIHQGKIEQARKVLDMLNKPGAEQEKEEILAQARDTSQRDFRRIFKRDVLRLTAWGAWVQAAQQLSGIDFVLFYAPVLFLQAGLSSASASFVASGVTGLVLLGSTVIAAPFMDRIGRKLAIVGGGFVIGGSLIFMGILYASGANNTKAGRIAIIAFIELFVCAFSITWAMHIRIYTTEIHPGYTRAAASSFGMAVNQLVNFMVALTAPAFLAASASGPYFTFGSVTLATSVLCIFIMNETRGLSLESIGLQSASGSTSVSRLLAVVRRKAGVASQVPLESRNSMELSPVQSIAPPLHSPIDVTAAVDIQPPLPTLSNLVERRSSRPTAPRPELAISAVEQDPAHMSVHSAATSRVTLA